MSKPYRDAFGNPLYKKDVIATVQFVLSTSQPSPMLLSRHLNCGYGKAIRLLSVLHHANVITGPSKTKPSAVIIKGIDQATNAALRQLKKGKKS